MGSEILNIHITHTNHTNQLLDFKEKEFYAPALY